MTLLRAMSPEWVPTRDLLQALLRDQVEKVVDGRSVAKMEGKVAVDDVVYPSDSERAGEIIIEAGNKITKNVAEIICTSGSSTLKSWTLPERR